MKKTIILSSFLVLMISLFYQINLLWSKQEAQKQLLFSNLDLSLEEVHTKALNIQDLLANKNAQLVFINPECEYCQDEVAALLNYSGLYPVDNKILFISGAPKEQVKDFSPSYAKRPDVYFLHDSSYLLSNLLAVKAVPSIILLDKNSKVLARINGETKPEYLFNFYQDEK